MSKAWSARSAAERKEVEAAFVARHGAELLLDGDAEPPSEAETGTPRARRRLPFAHLHAALAGGGPLPPEVSEVLRTDPGTRDDFALLLERSAWQHLPRAAAAAGRGGLERREAGGFVLRVVASRAGRDQVYLLVELPEEVLVGADAPEGEPEREPAGNRAGDRAGDRTSGRAGAEAKPVPGPDAGLGPDAGAAPDAGSQSEAGSGSGSGLEAAPAATLPEPAREHTGTPARRPGEVPTSGPTKTAPGRIVVRTAGGEFLKRALPSPEARTIRLVMAADDPLVRAVAEPASEIFLL